MNPLEGNKGTKIGWERKTWIAAGLTVACLAIASLVVVFSSHDYPRGQGVVWVWSADWNPDSYARIAEVPEYIDVVSPVWYTINESGDLHQSAFNAANLSFWQAHGIQVVPLVNNYDGVGFNQTRAHQVLATSPARVEFVTQVAQVIAAQGYDGINIDFEDVPEGDRAALTSLVAELKAALPGKIVSIDVPAKTEDTTTGWAGPFDYAALGQSCDYVCVMAYDYHWATSDPGPIAPLAWLDQVAEFAGSEITLDRVLLGIPFYGYDWPSNGTAATSDGIGYFRALATTHGASSSRDASSGELSFSYTDGFAVAHTCYYMDTEAIHAKMDKADANNLGGYACWYVGLEPTSAWNYFT